MSEDGHLPISCLYSVAPKWEVFLYSKIIRPFLSYLCCKLFSAFGSYPHMTLLSMSGGGDYDPPLVTLCGFFKLQKNLSLLLISFPKWFNSVPIDFKVNLRTVNNIGPCTSAANQIPPNHKWLGQYKDKVNIILKKDKSAQIKVSILPCWKERRLFLFYERIGCVSWVSACEQTWNNSSSHRTTLLGKAPDSSQVRHSSSRIVLIWLFRYISCSLLRDIWLALSFIINVRAW